MPRINLIYQNVRGLNTKLEEFYTPKSFWCITESWLSSSIFDSEILDSGSGYEVFRREDDSTPRGRGVLALVKSYLQPVRVTDLETDECQAMWVRISVNSVIMFALFIRILYFPKMFVNFVISIMFLFFTRFIIG